VGLDLQPFQAQPLVAFAARCHSQGIRMFQQITLCILLLFNRLSRLRSGTAEQSYQGMPRADATACWNPHECDSTHVAKTCMPQEITMMLPPLSPYPTSPIYLSANSLSWLFETEPNPKFQTGLIGQAYFTIKGLMRHQPAVSTGPAVSAMSHIKVRSCFAQRRATDDS
jgi:hypothetical protein